MDFLKRSQKIIFNRTLEREVDSNLSLRGTEQVDSTGITNIPRSRYYFDSSLRRTSDSIANDFKGLILNVF